MQWHDKLADVPKQPTLLIAQEFFDALPVHQFEVLMCIVTHSLRFMQKVQQYGWVERLVDVDEDERYG